MELRVALEALLTRFPDHALQRARWERQASDTNRGFVRLPVRLAGD